MPTLKMSEDKILTITKSGNTYEDENNAEVIKALLPRQINSNDLSDCVIHLCMINQDNLGDEINVSSCLKEYNDDLYTIDIDITSRITYKSGQIQLWIKVINSDNEMVAKTNHVTYQIKEHLDIEDYIPEQQLSLLDDFSIRTEQALEKTEGLIEDVEDIKEKVNNGEFHNGESAYEIAVRNGYEGTEQEWLESLQGEDGYTPIKGVDYFDGDKGEKGNDGTSVTVSSISESTADGGSNVITFSDGNTIVIKNGTKGSSGATGSTGAQGEKGEKGDDGSDGRDGIDGKDGLSAYEIAVKNGFKNSETEWLESLRGQDGKDGVDGQNGANGKDGINGADGYTPQKGKDYYTEVERQELIDEITTTVTGDMEIALDSIIAIQNELIGGESI